MPTPELKSRLLHLSPDRFVLSLLLGVCVLWLSDRFQWFGFNHRKGWSVLIAVATVGVAALVMLFWWVASLILRWRFQFGIRSLLVFCLASSIAAGWLAVEMKEARRQAEAVKAIESSGGSVTYDWQVDVDASGRRKAQPPEPEWLRNLLGADFSPAVVVIYDDDATITDAGLKHLKGLTQLRELYLNYTKITDARLEQLKGLTQLLGLYLNGTQITNAGLEHLKGLPQLRALDLSGTNITDAGLEHLTELTQLGRLDLHGTNITDAGLEHLKGVTQLRDLDLTGTSITNAGVKRLQQALPNCEIHH